MPELPEVEVVRRSIDVPLRGARVLALRLGKPLRWPLGCAPADLAGRVVGPVQRRGKYLWMPLAADGREPGGLLWHLGMSGSLALLGAGPAPPGPHDHLDLVTDRGTLRLHDPRRFGAVVFSRGLDVTPAAALLARLGPEPFDPALTPLALHAALRRRRAAVKSVLLAGDVVVGAGNIYACEALFAAGIHPALRADRISRPRAARLLAALRATLGRALELGGSTLRDFSDAHGAAGAYQAQAAVYGRAGQPCLRCGAAVRRIVQGQRSTFFCPACQKR
ncbi:MAG: bifunctional DNA-formamidopyrimidine glycosylase/DNA-(apurinic or apyrimidinic site) lyase [Pseudomonadota bacterium]|jgi:formamidopyrimidine-DNA glycosylase|nr:bifunctional DNA-formamidopyrimidine glycosylase/DNA-(apurinic or apyrimidinic site) lyase [Rubrivivax sp.]MCA3260188.1 bifunctional DNA-formamidopyrimidine glycosylase/DNA-(apurinic or apyrimidinic site) lyase [Rubrivivax sp.]MCE2913579.1 bifunctional DNA-formamidopyrimidine glycosylase/DNA-(apurinic or apyrimidinic site) lyase [Rubrivivax sp.]MCZ8032967.1 bifunctional DNA-formamidopyrimidine glycosylase/DNA-(apurinic or apyrimidinic site) lyase [Rubrivivax sp.]